MSSMSVTLVVSSGVRIKFVSFHLRSNPKLSHNNNNNKMGLVPADIAQVLFEAYQEEPSLSVARCQQLAEETGLEVRQVSRWFGARRRNGPPKQLGFTVTQRNALYEAFREHGSNPSKEICHQLTLTLGLSRQQVRKWFFDHRNDQSSSKDRLRQLTSTGNKRRSTGKPSKGYIIHC